MITIKTIDSYSKTTPVTEELYNSLRSNYSESANIVYTATQKTIKEYLVSQDVKLSPTSTWLTTVCSTYTIEELTAILEKEVTKRDKQLHIKFLSIFNPLIYRILGYQLNLDMLVIAKKDRGYLGNALVLAALYHYLKSGV